MEILQKNVTRFFNDRYGFKKSLLTTFCADALEMAALVINIEPDDKVIIPSNSLCYPKRKIPSKQKSH